MSFITYYVVLISLVFAVVTSESEYPNKIFQYLTEIEKATESRQNNIKFLQSIMKVDYLWSPILNEKVRVQRSTVEYFDSYTMAPDENMENVEVLPLENITTLFESNIFTGTDVQFTMKVLKTAVTCLTLKHISLGGLMLHRLMETFSETIEYDKKVEFFRWLVDMIHVSIEKLTALDIFQLLINRMRQHLVELYTSLSNNKTYNPNTKILKEIGLEMFTEINNICAKPVEEEGHYAALIVNLNTIKKVEDLKAQRSLIIETMRDSTNMIDLDIMNNTKGKIDIDKQIDANGIDTLQDNDTLKRAYAANYVQMNFLFTNLPVHTLTKSQWTKLFQLEKYTKPNSHEVPQTT